MFPDYVIEGMTVLATMFIILIGIAALAAAAMASTYHVK